MYNKCCLAKLYFYNNNIYTVILSFFKTSLGCPVVDTGKEKVFQIQINWSLADFKQFICQSFPDVSLNLTGYELARADRGKNLKKVQVTSVKELKKAVGRSRLYILPLAELHQVCNNFLSLYLKVSVLWC